MTELLSNDFLVCLTRAWTWYFIANPHLSSVIFVYPRIILIPLRFLHIFTVLSKNPAHLTKNVLRAACGSVSPVGSLLSSIYFDVL